MVRVRSEVGAEVEQKWSRDGRADCDAINTEIEIDGGTQILRAWQQRHSNKAKTSSCIQTATLPCQQSKVNNEEGQTKKYTKKIQKTLQHRGFPGDPSS
jgi:hypothetical protein